MSKPKIIASSSSVRETLAAAGIFGAEADSFVGWMSELLMANEYAKLEQGGHARGSVPLRRVFVDLPVSRNPSGQSERTPFLNAFLDAPEVDLDGFLPELRDSAKHESAELDVTDERPHDSKRSESSSYSMSLLIGGPGQGKSTLGQLASQMCRAIMLKPYSSELTTQQVEVLDALLGPQDRRKGRNRRVGDIVPPARPLVPLHVVLPDLAVWLGAQPKERGEEIPSIITFITSLPSAEKHSLRSRTLLSIASTVPILLVLDGFDEVGSAHDRNLVVEAARQLVFALAKKRAKAKVIATTRPQGYAGELSAIGLPLVVRHLVPLEPKEAIVYAEKLVRAKVQGPDQQERLLHRIREAASDPATSRLLTTPLQVTILAALVQHQGRVPRERWRLFSRYFEYTYRREVERETYASRLLADRQLLIEAIHARVGLLLQADGERDGGTGKMSRSQLNSVISAVLAEDEVAEEVREDLQREILRAAEERLVFLVEPEPGKFGFEIRSFQEFMAAWAITSGREEDIESRIRQISTSALFRNTLLFASSRLYSENSPLREQIPKEICLSIEQTDDAARLSRSGALLALEMLEEGAPLSQAKRARALMETAATLLGLPAGPEHARLARVANIDTAATLLNALELALRADPSCLSAWVTLIQMVESSVGGANELIQRFWVSLADKRELLRAHRLARLAIGPWLGRRIDEFAKEVTFRDLAHLEFNQGTAGCWASYVAEHLKAFGPHALFLDGFPAASAFATLASRPEGPPPSEWLPWLALTEFRQTPSRANLSAALSAIASRFSPNSWSDLVQYSSWPLVTCLLTADGAQQLGEWAASAEDGSLGDIDDWTQAEKSWSKESASRSTVAPFIAGLPWTPTSLLNGPPFALIASKTTRFIVADTRRRSQSVDRLLWNTPLETLGSRSIRRMIADYLLQGLRLKRTPTRLDEVKRLVEEKPSGIAWLIPRPKWQPVAEWKELLSLASAVDDVWIEADLDSAIDSLVESGGNPLCARAAVNILMYGRHFRHGNASRAGYTAGLHEALERLERHSQGAALDAAIIRTFYNIGGPDHEEALTTLLQNTSHSDSRWLSLLGTLKQGMASKDKRLRILLGATRILERDSFFAREAIVALREFLQARSTGLLDGAVWERLRLPLPTPFFNTEQMVQGSVLDRPIALSSIDISQVRGLSSLSLQQLAQPSEEHGQWVVILGQNGTGKTTLLRSIALALRNARDPSIWPDDAFRSPWPRQTDGEATVTIALSSGLSYTTILKSGVRGVSIDQRPMHTRPRIFPLFAYGCRRGSALGGTSREVNLKDDGGPEVGTLFSEGRDIIHASTWLLILEGDSSKSAPSRLLYENVLRALCTLMNVRSIRVRDRSLWTMVREGDAEIPFEMLSDGYLTAAGWFIDLVARYAEFHLRLTGEAISSLETMRGLVLIDEIDLHLHPRWQVEVISRTRALLPQMSFVVTTHNPLTLVGAKPEEIWILAHDERGVVVANRGVDAPMLLTSGQIYRRYFGIEDIYPEAVGRQLNRYSFLPGYAERNDEEDGELSRLKVLLSGQGVLPNWEIVARQSTG